MTTSVNTAKVYNEIIEFIAAIAFAVLLAQVEQAPALHIILEFF